MSAEVTIGDVVVGLEIPVALALVPVVVAAVLGLTYWRAAGGASDRSRRLLTLSRVAVAVLVVLAVAGPYTISTRETPGDPRVTLLTDDSASMEVVGGATGLADDIEAEGVPTRVATVGNGSRSRVGDGIVANLRENGSVVVVSDGQVTDGASLAEAGETARGLNATVSAVRLRTRATERHVRIDGPSKTSAGVPAAFLVSVGGTQTNGSVDLTVSVDGEEVATHTFERGSGAYEVRHTFNDTGPHRVVAEIESQDRYRRNDAFRSTVRVVERPRILYVASGQGAAPTVDYPLRGLPRRLVQRHRCEERPRRPLGLLHCRCPERASRRGRQCLRSSGVRHRRRWPRYRRWPGGVRARRLRRDVVRVDAARRVG